jgi:glycosyltransferase involved in cell wall biosynthesis
MLVSVVVPCTDRAEGFLRCVRSILLQDFEGEVEVVVVENNSMDRAVIKSILGDIRDRRVRHVYLPECENANVARNFGVSMSRGGYIAFCDSDDYWDACHLKSKVACLQQGKKAVYSGNYTDRGNRLKTKASYQVKENPVDFLFGGNRGYAQTSSFVVERSVFEKINWDEELKRSQDYDFFIQVQNEFTWVYDENITSYVYWPRNEIRSVNVESARQFLAKYKEAFSDECLANYYFDRLMDSCMLKTGAFASFSKLISPYRFKLPLLKHHFTRSRLMMQALWLFNQNVK